jgi:hypothetical protein
MKTQLNSMVKRGVLFAAGALLTATFVGLLLTKSTAQAGQKQANDRASFLGQAAVMGTAPGSPIKGDTYVWVCYKGKETKRIKVKYFLKGYPNKYVNGPCPTWTLVCDNGKYIKFVKTADLAKYLSGHPGSYVGNCTGTKPDTERLICWKGWNISVKLKYLYKYPGYTIGICP